MSLTQNPARQADRLYHDVEVLRDAGVTDLSPYGSTGELEYDIFVDRPR